MLVCIIIGIVDRKCSLGNHIFYDGLVAVAIVMFYQLFELPKVITVPLEYLGKHSMNIFLFHTFIFYYWFKSFIYSPRNPFLILCLLLGVCLLLSIFLEKVKQWIGFNKLLSKLK